MGERNGGRGGRLQLRVRPDAPETPPATERRARLRFLAITAFSACLAAVTLALLMFGPLSGLGPVRLLFPQWEMFVILCLLWAVTVYTPISLHHGGNTYLMSLDAVPMSIGLVFLSPPLFVLSCVVAEVFVLGVLRRQALVKVIFNVASNSFCAAVAAIVFRELLYGHSPVSLGGGQPSRPPCWSSTSPQR